MPIDRMPGQVHRREERVRGARGVEQEPKVEHGALLLGEIDFPWRESEGGGGKKFCAEIATVEGREQAAVLIDAEHGS